MAKLEDCHKQFIVDQLAEFRTAAEVSRLLREEWGVEVNRFQVRTYDPTKPAYAGGDKWREIFNAKRKAYLGSFDGLPIASDGFRLREMQAFYFSARDKGNVGLSMKILKEAGELTSRIASKIPPNMIPRPAHYDMTMEEKRAAVADMLRKALGADRVPDDYTCQ